jgi:hypothetical protein
MSGVNSKDDRQEGADLIYTEVQRARTALNRYREAFNQAVAQNRNPYQVQQVMEERRLLHTAVMNAHQTMRPYMLKENAWDDEVLDGDADIVGMEALDEYDLAFYSETVTQAQDYGPDERVVRRELATLTDQAYRSAINCMLRVAEDHGFAPQSQEATIRGEGFLLGGTNDDGVDPREEWKKEHGIIED